MRRILRHANHFIDPGKARGPQAEPDAAPRRRAIERDEATP